MSSINVVSGRTDEANPEFFDIRAMPRQPEEKKPGQLPEESIRKFFEDVSLITLVSVFFPSCFQYFANMIVGLMFSVLSSENKVHVLGLQ